MEIFFVSSDRDQVSFDEYCAEMPWQAMPYEKSFFRTFLVGHSLPWHLSTIFIK